MSHALQSQAQPSRLGALLARYSDDHRNPTNQGLHTVCVPVILWSAIALLWSLHPAVAIVGAPLAAIYYLSLSLRWGLAMALVLAAGLALAAIAPYRLWLALALFVLAWVGQFVGHAIEGRRPSFLDDLKFLLIGPLWVLVKAVHGGRA